MEPVNIEIGIDGGINLGVSTAQLRAQTLPVTIAAVSAAVHLDEAGTVVGDDDLSVGGAVANSQRVEDAADVGDHGLGFFGFGIDGDDTVIYELRAVGRSVAMQILMLQQWITMRETH